MGGETMGLVLRKNFILTPQDNSFVMTVVKTYPNSKRVVLCEQDRKNPKKPFIHRIDQPLRGFPLNALKSELGSFDLDNRFLDFKDKPRLVMAVWRRSISPIVDDRDKEELFFQGLLSKDDLEIIAVSQNRHVSTLYRNLGLYYGFGQFEEALLPFFNLIAENRTVPIDHLEAARRYPTGIGLDSDDPNPYRRRHNKVDIANIKEFAGRYLSGVEDYTLAHLQALFNAIYAIEEVIVDGVRDYKSLPHRFLSMAQFTYLFKKYVKGSRVEKLRGGSKAFNNDYQVSTGAATDLAVAPTSRYEIDATILDVYVISRLTTKSIKVIGRPVLYTVSDTSSTTIVGYYLSVNTQKWESVIFAIFSAMTDKVAQCARYGVHIKPDDWPCFHLCNELVIDNGTEYPLKGIEQIIESRIVKIGVDVAESYIGKSKGTEEGLFNILTSQNIKPLKGSVHKDRAKAKSHPSTNAIFTIDDINEIIIKGIMMHNHTGEVPDKVTQEAMVKGVEPSPISVFKWGLKHLMDGGMSLPASEIMVRLLPRQEATVVKKGIFIKVGKKRLRYVEEDKQFREWREEKSLTGGAKIEVIVSPLDTSQIWYSGPITDNRLIKLPLMSQQERLKNLHMSEALDALQSESVFMSRNRRKKELFRAVLAAETTMMTKENMKALKGVKKINGKAMPPNIKDNRVVDLELEMNEMSLDISSILAGVDLQQNTTDELGEKE